MSGAEVSALVAGAEAERLFPGDLRGLCLLKQQAPEFTLTQAYALDGAQPSEGAPWSLAQVLRWLELRLIAAATFSPPQGLPVPTSPQAAARQPEVRAA